MPFCCSFCPRSCSDRYPYRFGRVRGFLCSSCARGLEQQITEWAADRTIELAHQATLQTERERHEFAKAEPRDVALEGHPRGFRRAVG